MSNGKLILESGGRLVLETDGHLLLAEGGVSFQIQFAGLAIDGVSEWGERIASRVSPDIFPRRQGAIVSDNPFIGPRTVQLSGAVDKADEEALRDYLASLHHKLSIGKGKLFLRDDYRYLNVVKSDFGFSYRASTIPAMMAHFDIHFIAGDPYWYSLTESNSAEQAIGASPTSFPVTNSGGATAPPRIEITPTTGNKTGTFKIINTTIGLPAQFTGTVTNNQTLVIDNSRMRVRNGGGEGLAGFAGSFWNLEPGLNNIEYIGPTGVTVILHWRHRWE